MIKNSQPFGKKFQKTVGGGIFLTHTVDDVLMLQTNRAMILVSVAFCCQVGYSNRLRRNCVEFKTCYSMRDTLKIKILIFYHTNSNR